jgi:hypothetical protein
VKVGFFLQGPHLMPLAESLVWSIRKAMPDVHIAHLTDGECPPLPGTETIRIPEDMPMGVRRVTHYTRLEGDWCFCGVDVLFRKDVRSVFEKPFDVALASRKGTVWERSPYSVLQPYNFDILFSRSPKFWEAALKMMKQLPLELQDNGAEQLITNLLAVSDLFDVEIISSAYNFTPKNLTDDVGDVSILHLKGGRKAWIPALAGAIARGNSRVELVA